MITITRVKTNQAPVQTLKALAGINLDGTSLENLIKFDHCGDKFTFSIDAPITENDRQALEKIIRGLGEWFGEIEYQESVVLTV